VFDYVDVIPNPARSPKVKLPEVAQEEVTAPSFDEWSAIKANIAKRSSLAVRLIECTALRISEALELTYGDIDFAAGRIRVSKARTKRRTAGQRWLPLPDQLRDEIAALVPTEDRHRDRRVFQGLSAISVRQDLERACRDAGIAAYHPHSLRHRRCSLWYSDLRDAVAIKVWSGHSRASILTDLYSHVLVDHRDGGRPSGERRTRPSALAVFAGCSLKTRKATETRFTVEPVASFTLATWATLSA
jgi:integrase